MLSSEPQDFTRTVTTGAGVFNLQHHGHPMTNDEQRELTHKLAEAVSDLADGYDCSLPELITVLANLMGVSCTNNGKLGDLRQCCEELLEVAMDHLHQARQDYAQRN